MNKQNNDHRQDTSNAFRQGAAAWKLQLIPAGSRAEIVVSMMVLAIVLSMILPLPVLLLDVLIALNICTAALLVLIVMQLKESISLSVFPTLLLVTTLFRLSLNVASTRIILLEGEAGHIIEAFGEVVIGGNLVVGFVIFLILTIIQFLVITKGSERVAEVGARFTLDAMPGKQLAVDMELKAGAINAEQARIRRGAIVQESQFFGAMDGAMKFVKGDAIAGIIVTFTNLIGGISIGVLQKGMNVSEATHLYSLLSIGEALVAQIPALMLSLASGLLTTRVANTAGDEPTNVGKEMASQIMRQPKAWVLSSGAMLAFGLMPGMPTWVFALFAVSALSFGLKQMGKEIKSLELEDVRETTEIPSIREFDLIRPFLMRVGSHVEDVVTRQYIVNIARLERNELVANLGLVTPAIQGEIENVLMDDADLEFCHYEVRVFAMRLRIGLFTAVCSPQLLLSLSISPVDIESGEASIGALNRIWVNADDALKLNDHLEVMDFWQYLRWRTRESLHRDGPRHMGVEQTQKLIQFLQIKEPEFSKEFERVMPVTRMTEVLQRLLRERVSIRNLSAITTALLEWGAKERDPGILTEYVRDVLGRQICAAYAKAGCLNVFVLEAEFEQQVRGAVRQTAYGDFLALEQGFIDLVLDQFADHLSQHPLVSMPVVICTPDIRTNIRRLLELRFDHVGILSLNQVPPSYRMQVLGVLGAMVKNQDNHPSNGPSASSIVD